jgi:hypothetical protein
VKTRSFGGIEKELQKNKKIKCLDVFIIIPYVVRGPCPARPTAITFHRPNIRPAPRLIFCTIFSKRPTVPVVANSMDAIC